MDHLCYFCLVSVMFSRLFIAALWSSTGKGLTSWLSFVMFNCVLLLSHVVSRVRCGTLLYRFLIFATFLTLTSVLINDCELGPVFVSSQLILNGRFPVMMLLISNLESKLNK